MTFSNRCYGGKLCWPKPRRDHLKIYKEITWELELNDVSEDTLERRIEAKCFETEVFGSVEFVIRYYLV